MAGTFHVLLHSLDLVQLMLLHTHSTVVSGYVHKVTLDEDKLFWEFKTFIMNNITYIHKALKIIKFQFNENRSKMEFSQKETPQKTQWNPQNSLFLDKPTSMAVVRAVLKVASDRNRKDKNKYLKMTSPSVAKIRISRHPTEVRYFTIEPLYFYNDKKSNQTVMVSVKCPT